MHENIFQALSLSLPVPADLSASTNSSGSRIILPVTADDGESPSTASFQAVFVTQKAFEWDLMEQ